MQVNTLYNDSSDLRFDLSIFGQIVLSSQTDRETLRDMIYEEMSEVRPIKTFEVQRRMLSEQVSADYVIKYNSEIQLTEGEIEVDFDDLSELEDYDVADELLEFEEEVKEVKSRCIIHNERSPLSLRQVDKINKAYEMFMSSGLEKFDGNVNELEQQILQSKHSSQDSIGVDENIDSSSSENQDLINMEDVEVDFSNMSTSGYEDEEVDLSEYSESDGEYDIEDELLEDEVKETGVAVNSSSVEEDTEDNEDDYYDFSEDEEDEYSEGDYEDEDYEEDYTDDEDEYVDEDDEYSDEDDEYEDEVEEQRPIQVNIRGKTYFEYIKEDEYIDEDDDYTDDSEYEEDTDDDYEDYTDEEDEYEDDEEEYTDDEDYTEDEEEDYTDDDENYEDNTEEDVVEEVQQQDDNDFELEDDFFEPPEEKPKQVVESKPEPVKEEIKEVQKEQPKPREEEPKDLIQFLRKHPKCEISFALQYFSKKEIEKHIRTGSIIKKNGKLFF